MPHNQTLPAIGRRSGNASAASRASASAKRPRRRWRSACACGSRSGRRIRASLRYSRAWVTTSRWVTKEVARAIWPRCNLQPMRVAKPRTVIALAAVIAISMSEASQAETVRLKTSRGTVCTAEASVSATTGMSKSVTYGAEVPRCGNREGLRRIQSLGLLYGEGTLGRFRPIRRSGPFRRLSDLQRGRSRNHLPSKG